MNQYINSYSIKSDQISTFEYLYLIAERLLHGKEILIEETADNLKLIAEYVRELEASNKPSLPSLPVDSEKPA